jgi:hypothetical protein
VPGRRVTALLVAITSLVAACVGPSRSTADYREKAANSAEAMRSVVQTSRLVTEAALDGKAPSRYTALVLSESENDADSISDSFSTVQPPSRESDRLRERTTTLLDGTTSLLADLRIAVRRGDEGQMRDLVGHLARVSKRLERLSSIVPT